MNTMPTSLTYQPIVSEELKQEIYESTDTLKNLLVFSIAGGFILILGSLLSITFSLL